jgi:hypothetical protein
MMALPIGGAIVILQSSLEPTETGYFELRLKFYDL